MKIDSLFLKGRLFKVSMILIRFDGEFNRILIILLHVVILLTVMNMNNIELQLF